MAVSGTAKTYDLKGNREDLQNAIFEVDRSDTPFCSMIAGKKTANAKYHEWQTQDLAAANADNAVVEGADFGASSVTATARIGNYTQIMDKVAQISSSQEKTTSAGRSSEMNYQVGLKMKELKKDLEAACLSDNVAVAGDGSTARKMRGVESWLSTNAEHGTGGSTNASTGAITDGTQAAFSKDTLDTLLQNTYDAGGRVDTLLVGSSVKGAVSDALNTTNERTIAAEGNKVSGAIDVYMSDFGVIKIMLSPQQRGRTALALQSDMFDVAFLQPMHTVNIAKTGHSEKKAVVCEATVVVGNEKSSGKYADITV